MRRVLDTKKCCLNLDRYDRTIVVGDLHGDFSVLIKVLKRSGVAKVDDDVGQSDLFKCYSGPIEQRRGINLDPSKIRWLARKTAIVFLGDILDNRRRQKGIEF